MMSLLWTYFVFAERLTIWFGNETAEVQVLRVTQTGSFAPLYWTMVVCNFVVPFTILSLRRLRTITGCVIGAGLRLPGGSGSPAANTTPIPEMDIAKIEAAASMPSRLRLFIMRLPGSREPAQCSDGSARR